MVDIDASELVADGLVDEHGSDGGIDTTRETANHPALADLGADLFDGALAIGRHRPVGAQPHNVVDEVGKQAATVGRMHHLRVKHGGVAPGVLVHRDGEGRIGRRGHDTETGRQFGDAVAVAHPHRIALTDVPDALVEAARRLDLDISATELAGMAAFDTAAELQGERLLAVADGEYRHGGIEDRLRGARAACIDNRGRPA